MPQISSATSIPRLSLIQIETMNRECLSRSEQIMSELQAKGAIISWRRDKTKGNYIPHEVEVNVMRLNPKDRPLQQSTNLKP